MRRQRVPSHHCPDGGWGWVVVLGSFLNHFLFEGLIRSYGLIYQVLLGRFSGSAATTAWIQATFNAFALMIGPFTSILAERATCRLVVLLGGILLCGGLLLSAHTPNLYFLYFSYSFIGGCGGGLIYSPMIVILSEYFDTKRGMAMGIAALGGAVGTASMPLLVGYLLHNYGYSGSLTIMAAIILHHCISGILYRPVPRKIVTLETSYFCSQSIFGSRELYERHPVNGAKDNPETTGDRLVVPQTTVIPTVDTKPDSKPVLLTASENQKPMYLTVPEKPQHVKGDRQSKVSYGKDYSPIHKDAIMNATVAADKSRDHSRKRQPHKLIKDGIMSICDGKLKVLKNISFLLFCFNLFNIPTTLISTFIFLPGLAGELGVDDTGSALLLSIIGVASAVGRLSFGFVFDIPRVNRHRRLVHSVLGTFLGLSTAALAICNSFVAMSLMSVVVGLSEGGVMAQRATALSQYVRPNQLAFAFGILTMFQGFGNLTGPLLQGYLKDVLGTYTVCFYYGGGVTLLSSVLLVTDYLARSHTKTVTTNVHGPEID